MRTLQFKGDFLSFLSFNFLLCLTSIFCLHWDSNPGDSYYSCLWFGDSIESLLIQLDSANIRWAKVNFPVLPSSIELCGIFHPSTNVIFIKIFDKSIDSPLLCYTLKKTLQWPYCFFANICTPPYVHLQSHRVQRMM